MFKLDYMQSLLWSIKHGILNSYIVFIYVENNSILGIKTTYQLNMSILMQLIKTVANLIINLILYFVLKLFSQNKIK